MADQEEESDTDLPAAQRVEDDRNCVGCSYNLRGLQVNGRCPECGYSIQRSLMGPLLRYSSTEYLQTLQRGVLLLIIAALASVGIGLFTFALEMVIVLFSGFQFQGGPGWGPGGPVGTAGTADTPGAGVPAAQTPGIAGLVSGLSDVSTFLTFAAEAAGAIVAIVGWYMLSAEDPSFVGTENGSKTRRAVRVLTIVRLAAVLGGLVFLGLDHFFQLPMEIMIIGGAVTGAVPVLAWAAVTIVGMLYIAWLARRIPDEVMATRARRYAWMLPVIYVFLACCVGLGPLIALVLYVILLFQLRAALVKTVQWQESEEGKAYLAGL